MPEQGESESPLSTKSDSSFSTVSSAPLTSNGVGCSSIFIKFRGRTRHRPVRAGNLGLRIRTNPYPRIHDRVSLKPVEVERNRSPVAGNLFPVQKENHQKTQAQKPGEATPPNEVKKSGSLSSAIADIFRCFICLGKLVDAHLCPCCSKLVCMQCIKRWLTDQKSECPHCRAPLFVSQLVNCKFISDITTEVEKIHGNIDEDAPPEKICPTHGSPLSYFCTTCSTPVCSDCAILAENHQNHSFERLSVTYGRHSEKLHVEASALRTRLNELYNVVASVDKDIEAVLKAKDDQANEIETAFKRMRAKLEEQLKCKLLTLLAQKGTVSQEVEHLETIIRQLDFQLSTSSKSDLIAFEPTMSSIIHDLRKRINTDIRRDPVSADFISEVVPPFEHGELILENFRKLFSGNGSKSNDSSDTSDTTNDIVYSAPISAAGITWRLKVYPNGSGASKGSYISAFLEMVKGGSEPTTYEYGIEMLHPTQPHQKIVRRFSSDFEEGASWGYYQFFKVDDLERDGYLTTSADTITLNFYVRAQTYLQQCLDLRRALSACQSERDEAVTQVAVLRRAFASSIWQQRRRKGSVIGLEDDQGSIKSVLAGAVSSLLPDESFEQQLFRINTTAAKTAFTQLDKIMLSVQPSPTTEREVKVQDVPSEAQSCKAPTTTEECSEAPSMAVSKSSSLNSGSREKCELWLKSRENMFQMPAGKSRFYRRGSRYRKSYPNRSQSSEAVKRSRTEAGSEVAAKTSS